jgi:hypothetical protein
MIEKKTTDEQIQLIYENNENLLKDVKDSLERFYALEKAIQEDKIEWVLVADVDKELKPFLDDLFIFYNKEYQKHPFNKTHDKLMNLLELKSELSQSQPAMVDYESGAAANPKLKLPSDSRKESSQSSGREILVRDQMVSENESERQHSSKQSTIPSDIGHGNSHLNKKTSSMPDFVPKRVSDGRLWR